MSVFAKDFREYGPGLCAPIGSLEDDTLGKKLRDYKRNVAKRYRIADPGNFKRFLPKGRLWISPKIDGELWFLVKKSEEVALVAYNGRVLKGVPVVDEAEKLLKRAPDTVIAGELFAVPPQGEGRPRVHHVRNALSNGQLARTLGFKGFDVLEEDGESLLSHPYEDRLERLEQLLRGGRRVAPVHTEVVDLSGISGFYQDWVRSGKFEGIVAHAENGLTYKIKPRISIDGVVVGYSETNREGVDMMREMWVALMRDDGSLHVLGPVGTGFSDEERVDWRERLQKMHVESAFRMANREGTLVHFVRPEIVIEVQIADLNAVDTADQPVRRTVVRYGAESGYESLGMMPLASMLYPVFLRERDDKTVDVGSIGIDQVYRHIPFEQRHEKAEQVSLDTSEVVERGVYTKNYRDSIYVRKYVVITTHKSEEDARWPPWVVFFTDYSPNRKTPLKTDLRVAPTKEGVMAHVDAWIEKKIKRGWEEVEDPSSFRADAA